MTENRSEARHRVPSYVCSIADALQQGDVVVLNDRDRPITVLGRSEDQNPGFIRNTDYPYRVVWLRGNGTEYRLRYSHTGEYYPRLHTESELDSYESFDFRFREKRVKTIATNRGETVRRIAVMGIEAADLTQWALKRLIWEAGGRNAPAGTGQ